MQLFTSSTLVASSALIFQRNAILHMSLTNGCSPFHERSLEFTRLELLRPQLLILHLSKNPCKTFIQIQVVTISNLTMLPTL